MISMITFVYKDGGIIGLYKYIYIYGHTLDPFELLGSWWWLCSSVPLVTPFFSIQAWWVPSLKMAPENGWLEDDPFLLGWPIFGGFLGFRESSFICLFYLSRYVEISMKYPFQALSLPALHCHLNCFLCPVQQKQMFDHVNQIFGTFLVC